MRKIKSIIIFLGLFMPSIILGQGLGLRAGINFQNINGKDINDDKLEYNLTTGFHAGVNYEIPVGTDIYFQPGIVFSTKGSKIEEENFKTKISTSNIEIPLNLIFKPLLGTGHMLLGFGPYVAYAIGGKGTDQDFDIEFAGEVGDRPGTIYLKPFDAGANFIIGYELQNMLSLQLNAQLGLLNISSSDADIEEATWKNTGFGLSLGYRF